MKESGEGARMVTHAGANTLHVAAVAAGVSGSREEKKESGDNAVAPYRGNWGGSLLDEGKGAHPEATDGGAKYCGVKVDGNWGNSGPNHDGKNSVIKTDTEMVMSPCCYHHCNTDDGSAPLFLSCTPSLFPWYS